MQLRNVLLANSLVNEISDKGVHERHLRVVFENKIFPSKEDFGTERPLPQMFTFSLKIFQKVFEK